MGLLRGLFGGRQAEEPEEIDVMAEAQARVRKQPDNPEAHFDLGSTYYVRGRFEEAVQELERAVELAPDHADANYMLGLAYAKLNRFDDARRVFQAAGQGTENPMLQNYAQQKLKEIGAESIDEQKTDTPGSNA